jgi:hypothetical protein
MMRTKLSLMNWKALFLFLTLVLVAALPATVGAQRPRPNGIESIAPTYATRGDADVLVTITLVEANAPPSHVNPLSVRIGTLEGSAIHRDGLVITAVFDISADEPTGMKDVAIEFPAPRGTVVFKASDAFEIRADATQTVGLFVNEEGSYDGYTLFAPLQYRTTYLIDNEGRLVQSWDSAYTPGNSVYLLENGNLLRTATLPRGPDATFGTGGAGGRVEEFTWDGTLVWEFEYSGDQHLQHHDIERLPNGNVLMIAWEYKKAAEAITAGRDPDLLTDGELWPDHIIEVEPTGASGGHIVWEWHVWDHLIQDYDPTKDNYGVVADHPELIDLNFVGASRGRADWNHINSVDYNEQFDQILLSVPRFSEVWVIDHSTTTKEAAGHSGGNSGKGGDILYRWGNPQAYRAGDVGDRRLFSQHDAQWIESGLPGEGNILLFNNGNGRPGGVYSSVDEFVPPVDASGNYALAPGTAYGPEEQTWIYAADNPTDFFADHISGAQRLPNGNTLICDGPHGTLFEVTPEGEIVWKYINPVTNNGPLTQGDPIPTSQNGGQPNQVFRAYRYGPDYAGLADKDLTPGDPIELYPDPQVSAYLPMILKQI